MGWLRYDERSLQLTLVVHVQPNARHTGIAGLHGDALKVRIGAPAVDNKANKALIDFLSSELKIAASTMSVIRGSRVRRKVLQIVPADAALAARAARLAGPG
jgi:uncharacterized protein